MIKNIEIKTHKNKTLFFKRPPQNRTSGNGNNIIIETKDSMDTFNSKLESGE